MAQHRGEASPISPRRQRPVSAPRRNPDESVSRIRAIRTTDEEWERYTQAAEAEGLPRSEWIRRVLNEAAAQTAHEEADRA